MKSSPSKRAQEALERVYERIKKELILRPHVDEDILDIIEHEYEKEGGDVNNLFGIK